MEPIEKKVGFTSSLDKDQWHELFIRLMGRANPYKLVTDYDVVPEAPGQQASWRLPKDMAMIPVEKLLGAYVDLFKEHVLEPIQDTMYLFQDNPARVWREGRAKKEGDFEVYPDNTPGKKATQEETETRQWQEGGFPSRLRPRFVEESWQGPLPTARVSGEGYGVQVVRSWGGRLQSSRP